MRQLETFGRRPEADVARRPPGGTSFEPASDPLRTFGQPERSGQMRASIRYWLGVRSGSFASLLRAHQIVMPHDIAARLS